MGSAFKLQATRKKYGRTKEVASERKMLGEMGIESSKSNGLGLIPSITKQLFGDVLCSCNSFTFFKVP